MPNNKAVLLSVRPEWCKKILSGEKTVEVRKTRPKLETSFKVYIYCTKTAEGWLRTVPVQGWQRLDGFVIGEFTCNKIDTIQRMGIDNNFDYCYLSLNEFGNDDIAIEIRDIKKIPHSKVRTELLCKICARAVCVEHLLFRLVDCMEAGQHCDEDEEVITFGNTPKAWSWQTATDRSRKEKA